MLPAKDKLRLVSRGAVRPGAVHHLVRHGVVREHGAGSAVGAVHDVRGRLRVPASLERQLVGARRELRLPDARRGSLRRVEDVLPPLVRHGDAEFGPGRIGQGELVFQTVLRRAVLRDGDDDIAAPDPLGDEVPIGQAAVLAGRSAQVDEIRAVAVEGAEPGAGPPVQRPAARAPAERSVRVGLERARLVEARRLPVQVAADLARVEHDLVRLGTPLRVERDRFAVIRQVLHIGLVGIWRARAVRLRVPAGELVPREQVFVRSKSLRLVIGETLVIHRPRAFRGCTHWHASVEPHGIVGLCDGEVAPRHAHVVVRVGRVRGVEHALVGADCLVVVRADVAHLAQVARAHESLHRAGEGRVGLASGFGRVVNRDSCRLRRYLKFHRTRSRTVGCDARHRAARGADVYIARPRHLIIASLDELVGAAVE